MANNNVHFRHIMLFYFNKGKNATETQREICAVYGEDTVNERTCRKWFAKFRAGNCDLDDAPRSGRPVEVDDDIIQTLIKNNPRYSTRVIAEILKISQTAVVEHLYRLGYVNQLDVWIPHNLSEKNLTERVSVCDLLYKRNENDPFLKRIVTGDEKWIVYNNIVRQRSWGKQDDERPLSTPKAELHAKKLMLCIWWDWKGVLYYELLPSNQTVNSDVYCSQLDRLKAAIDKKRPELANRVVFHHDNARPYVSLVTRQKLVQLGWDVLPHPPYSPDLAPSDFHLFRSLQNSLNGKNFNTPEDCKNHLDQFFNQKTEKFYTNGIMKLPKRWQKVIEKNGAHVEEFDDIDDKIKKENIDYEDNKKDLEDKDNEDDEPKKKNAKLQ